MRKVTLNQQEETAEEQLARINTEQIALADKRKELEETVRKQKELELLSKKVILKVSLHPDWNNEHLPDSNSNVYVIPSIARPDLEGHLFAFSDYRSQALEFNPYVFKLRMYLSFLKQIENDSTIIVKQDRSISEYISYEKDPFHYRVLLAKNVYKVYLNPTKLRNKYSQELVTRSVPLAYSGGRHLILVPLPVGYQLLKTLPPNADNHWETDALQKAQDYANKRDLLVSLHDKFDGITYTDKLKLPLKPYQHVGSYFLSLAGSGILGDKMGLGKTPQTIAVVEHENLNSIIVVPSNAISNWVRQIKLFTGKIPNVLSGTTPETWHFVQLLTQPKQYNIISYESISRFIDLKDENDEEVVTYDEAIGELEIKARNLWVELLNNCKFDILIVDEAHRIKNMGSNRSKATRMIQTPRVIFASGTPILNRPAELFPMINRIDPSTFPSRTEFLKNYASGKNGVKNFRELRELMKPIMIRREQGQVQKDVAPLNRIPNVHRLTEKEYAEYAKIMAGIDVTTIVDGDPKKLLNELAIINKAKEVTALGMIPHTIELAETIIEEELESKHRKVIVFTFFKEVVAQVSRYFGKKALVITGDNPTTKRLEIAQQFQTDPNIDIIVCTTSAASEALDMTEAGNVIMNDLLWTPGDHEQCEGRAFGRVNDPHSINSHYMLAEETISEWLYQILFDKSQMIKAIDGKLETDQDVVGQSVQKKLMERIKAGQTF